MSLKDAGGIWFSSQVYAQLTAFSSVLKALAVEAHQSLLTPILTWAFLELCNTETNILLTHTIFNSILLQDCWHKNHCLITQVLWICYWSVFVWKPLEMQEIE